MDKIASPRQLTAELRTLLRYAESRNPSREQLAEQLTSLADRTADEEDPTERALRRMQDAFDRGGFDKMLQATQIRIKATKTPAKLRGIWDAINQVVRGKVFRLTTGQKAQLQALTQGDEFLPRGHAPSSGPNPEHQEWAKKILDVAEGLLDDAKREEDVEMRRAHRADASDLKKISQMILAGKLEKAKNAISNLDTLVREYIPQKVWDAMGMSNY